MNKNIGQIDQDTGEVMQGCMVWIPHRPKLTERWFMAFQDTFAELAKDPELTLEPKNVLLFLFSQLDFENFIHISQQDVASNLGMQKSQVSRAMKLLTKKHIVLESQKTGKIKCYRLNADYGWKGKVKNLEDHRRERFKVIQGGLSEGKPSAS